LFPGLLGQSEYNQRLKSAAPLMEAVLRWLAAATPARIVQRLLALNRPSGTTGRSAPRSSVP